MAYEKQSVWSCRRYANSGAGTIRGTCAGGGCKHNDGVPQESVKFTLTVKDSGGTQIYSETFEEGTEIKADEILEKVKKEKNSVSLTYEKTGEAFDSVKISEDIVLVAKYVRFFTLTVKDSEGNQIYIEDLAEETEIRADRLSEKEGIKKEGSSVYFTDDKTGKSFDSATISEDTALSAVYVEEGTAEEVTLTLDLYSSDGIESEKFKLHSAKVTKGTRLNAKDIMSKCVGSFGASYDYFLYDENGVPRDSVVVFKDMTVKIDQKLVPKTSVTIKYQGIEKSDYVRRYDTGSKLTRTSLISEIELSNPLYMVSSLTYENGTAFTDIESLTEAITLVATLSEKLSLPEVTVPAAQAAETIKNLAEKKKVIVTGEITDEISTQIFAAVKQVKVQYYLDLSGTTGLKSIPVGAFSSIGFQGRTAVIGIAFPDSLETIEKDAFSGNNYLLEVKFGKGLKTIGEKAFYYAISRAYAGIFTIPASVEKLEANAFGLGNETVEKPLLAFENKSGWSAKKGETVKTFTPEELSDPEKVKEYLRYNKYYSDYEWTRTPESTEEEPIE